MLPSDLRNISRQSLELPPSASPSTSPTQLSTSTPEPTLTYTAN
eukprot:CAMPEP_0174886478 /NCGR_PEP_ID=MMETSP0167-20121228/1721_1 /TAXON_ID=38298 /ORGANISM="Rhodella maculata, Strain CCMP736" /LENGTH=43 /DNA_ID= /DNA_START= /DNA_END= /DNA_ORIENTATION=